MADHGALLIGFLLSPLFMLILAFTSITLSIIALILAKRAVRKTTFTPITPPKVSKEKLVEKERKPEAPKKAAGKPAVEKPPEAGVRAVGVAKGETFEIKPSEAEEGLGFESLEELATMTGMRSILLFNLMGMAIESYNVKDDDRVSASAADFISMLREFNSSFDSLVIEDDQRVMLLSIGNVGEMEIFALAIEEPESALEVDDVRDLLRAYISGIMRRKE